MKHLVGSGRQKLITIATSGGPTDCGAVLFASSYYPLIDARYLFFFVRAFFQGQNHVSTWGFALGVGADTFILGSDVVDDFTVGG